MKTRFFFFLFLVNSLVFCQKVRVEADTTGIRIGEQFMFQIAVEDTSHVILPKKLENLRSLEVVEQFANDTIKSTLVKKYLITGFDSGAFYIPSQQIFIRNRAYFTDSILINVATVAVDTTKQGLFPIKAIQTEPYIYDDLQPYFLGAIIIALFIAAVLYYLIKRRKPQATNQKTTESLPPFEEAIKRLLELDKKLLWQNNEIKKYYSELTEIVRSYMERELKIPALEITTHELIETLHGLHASNTITTSQETIERLNQLFQEADLVKFAKSIPLSHEIEQNRRDAEEVLDSLKLVPKTKEKETDALE